MKKAICTRIKFRKKNWKLFTSVNCRQYYNQRFSTVLKKKINIYNLSVIQINAATNEFFFEWKEIKKHPKYWNSSGKNFLPLFTNFFFPKNLKLWYQKVGFAPGHEDIGQKF